MKPRWIAVPVLGFALMVYADQPASALPSWARRYDINCQSCHVRINRLNLMGLKMYRLGMRNAHDDTQTKNFGDYYNFKVQVDAKGRTDNQGEKSKAVPAFEPQVTLYGGGALSPEFSFLFESAISPEGSLELADIYAQYTSKTDNFWTVRFGQFLPWLMVDNPVEVAADRGAPFPRERRYGVEIGGVRGEQLYGAVAAVQSSDPHGVGRADRYDYVANGEYVFDKEGSSLGAFGWIGQYYRDATLAMDDYQRYGVIGNLNRSKLLVTGGFSAGKGNSANGDRPKTIGFFGNLDFLLRPTLDPTLNVTWFDPNTDASDDEETVATASLNWWAAENISLRPQLIVDHTKALTQYRYAFRAVLIF